MRLKLPLSARTRRNSGLLRYEFKSDLDWWHAARDILARQKADYVVMMLGVSDKQNIREKDLAKEADKEDADKKTADDKTKQDDDPGQCDHLARAAAG